MKVLRSALIASLWLASTQLAASCPADISLIGQFSHVKKKSSSWKIADENAYASNNDYYDFAVNYAASCHYFTEKLNVDVSLYALGWLSPRDGGAFERENDRSDVIIEKLNLSYVFTDSLSLRAGKIRAKEGIFYLSSPENLMKNYSAGFKHGQIYDPSLDRIGSQSYWGAVVTQDTPQHALSLAFSPRLSSVRHRYEVSGHWPEFQRSNTDDRYLLSYTDYRFDSYTPTVTLLLGNSKSLAFANSYNISPQFVTNFSLAWHLNQQWRHLQRDRAESLLRYEFPSELYSQNEDNGIELAAGLQYTSDRFDRYGIEYYFQSEGYSATEWKKQKNLIKFLNQRSGYEPLNSAFDAYKYLMASEIYNVNGRGNLLDKHYINGYASFSADDGATLRIYSVLNLRDYSSMSGINYNKPLDRLLEQLEIYTGIYASAGRHDSELVLFGSSLGSYVGFKYHF